MIVLSDCAAGLLIVGCAGAESVPAKPPCAEGAVAGGSVVEEGIAFLGPGSVVMPGFFVGSVNLLAAKPPFDAGAVPEGGAGCVGFTVTRWGSAGRGNARGVKSLAVTRRSICWLVLGAVVAAAGVGAKPAGGNLDQGGGEAGAGARDCTARDLLAAAGRPALHCASCDASSCAP